MLILEMNKYKKRTYNCSNQELKGSINNINIKDQLEGLM